MLSTLPPSWDIDKIINHLDEFGFYCIDDAYSPEFVVHVRDECLSNLQSFKQASIQNGVMSQIRRDHILWINDEFPVATIHVNALEQLGQQLNQHLFLGINEVEAHFACYKAGEFYALHRDNPQQKNSRVISSVFYLHKDWQADFGGQLRIQDKLGDWHIITPQPNRIVVFQSDLLHEVLVSKQQRLSITAWLRNQSSIW